MVLRRPSDKLILSDRTVDVWRVSCGTLQHLIPTLWMSLNSVERFHAEKYICEDDKARFVLTRGALRDVLGRYLGIASEEVPIESSPTGKPFVSSKFRLEFNASHSHDWALIAFAKARVGIDIEHMRHLQDASAIAERFFSPAEFEAVMNVSAEETFRAFYRCWTRKEAYIKASGEGLFKPLKSFSVSVNESDPRILWSELGRSEVGHWKFFNLSVPHDYSAAVVAESSIESVVERDWSFPQNRRLME